MCWDIWVLRKLAGCQAGCSAAQRAQMELMDWCVGWAGNGAHGGQKRGEGQGGHRQGSKGKAGLNGNAPSFVPVSGPGSQPNGSISNGIHPISYRNVAAGLMNTQAPEHSDQVGIPVNNRCGEPIPLVLMRGNCRPLSSSQSLTEPIFSCLIPLQDLQRMSRVARRRS